MIAVTIPVTDVNTETAVLVQWYVEDRAEAQEGQPVAEIETSKAILDVVAPVSGVLLHARGAGEQVRIGEPLGHVFDSVEALERHGQQLAAATSPAADAHAERITVPARRRATELRVDIDEVARTTTGLVTAKLVDAYAATVDEGADRPLPSPIPAPADTRRLVIIGAGLGATQVLDILEHDASQQAVAIVDDDRRRFGDVVDGVPVVGGVDRALELFATGDLDAAVISISTSVPARTRLGERCRSAGLPLANVIDPTARIARGVRLGEGNVICANCHFGVGTIVGDNNFLSAYNSFDHHNQLGSDISTGPGCMTSGLVTIEDRCRLGTGIFIEPHVTLGAGAQIASGAVIVSSVPAEHAVKTKIVTTSVVPLRQD